MNPTVDLSGRRRFRIGIVLPQDKRTRIDFRIPDQPYILNAAPIRNTTLTARPDGSGVTVSAKHDAAAADLERSPRDRWIITPSLDSEASGVIVRDCIAGRGFHWQSRIDLTIPGTIEIRAIDGHLLVVNELPLETYLKGVITAEMGGRAPVELLQAHAVVARSWTVARSERKHADLGIDYCNDDCCQRYQGVRHLTPSARTAVERTAGLVLMHAPRVRVRVPHSLRSKGWGKDPRFSTESPSTTGPPPEPPTVVDANYSKCCGGITEAPQNVWPTPKPAQHSRIDAPERSIIRRFHPVTDHNIAEYLDGPWLADGDAYCSPNVVPEVDLPRYLGPVDRGGGHFRWTVTYQATELEDLLRRKFFDRIAPTGDTRLAFLYDLVVTHRGSSGRATRLDIVYDDDQGRRQTATMDDQYWIRHALHEKFLYSSAFDARIARAPNGRPERITLRGAGWGHGAGMCQIGALGMALTGCDHLRILHHYFKDVTIESL